VVPRVLIRQLVGGGGLQGGKRSASIAELFEEKSGEVSATGPAGRNQEPSRFLIPTRERGQWRAMAGVRRHPPT